MPNRHPLIYLYVHMIRLVEDEIERNDEFFSEYHPILKLLVLRLSNLYRKLDYPEQVTSTEFDAGFDLLFSNGMEIPESETDFTLIWVSASCLSHVSFVIASVLPFVPLANILSKKTLQILIRPRLSLENCLKKLVDIESDLL